MRAITREELLTQSPASHYVKSWSGIVDPKDSTRVMTNPVWAQLTQKEPHEPHFHLFAAFTGGKLFLDIGANCGQSIISLKAVNQEARIKSFEPTSFSFAVAEKVARVFEDCEVFNFGLSDEPATLPIYTPVIDGLLITPLTSLDPAMFEPGGTMHAFLTNDIAKGAPVSIYREDVRLECGDDLALDPDVMKIDVEGAELRVLKGLSKTIARCQPLIMTEKSDAPAISAYLAKFGYFPCRYESARPADTRTLFRLPIDAATDPAAIPLNVFYVQKGKVALYKAEFGLQFE